MVRNALRKLLALRKMIGDGTLGKLHNKLLSSCKEMKIQFKGSVFPKRLNRYFREMNEKTYLTWISS